VGAPLAGLGALVVVAALLVAGVTNASIRTVAATCGTNVNIRPPNADPDRVVGTLPASTHPVYNTYPFQVRASMWKNFAGVKPPWKIGLVMFPLGNPYSIHVVDEMKRLFAKAKAQGLVTGKLLLNIQPSFATATPAQQIAAIQSMVRQGVNGIIIMPLNGEPLAAAIDEAGKKGIPVVSQDDVIPNSRYVTNIWSNKIPPAVAAVAGMVKKGNVLIARGIPGNSVEQAFYKGVKANLAACPGLKVVGEVNTNWDAPTAKREVLKFLAAHPGLKIDMVAAEGAMMAGIIDAFQTNGVKVPPISEGGSQGGDLSWWLAHKDTYRTIGSANNGYDVSWTGLHVLFRILAGKGMKVRDMPVASAVVTNANLAKYATPGQSLYWNGEPRGVITERCGTNVCLNQYFVKQGSPKGF